jgi:DNA-binding CsgD family transcriptional regulator
MASDLAFPWARSYDADQLGAFIEDLWGASGGDNSLATLDAIERTISAHRPQTAADEQPKPPVPPPCPLNQRQLRALALLASGASYADVMRALGITENCLRSLLYRAYRELRARNATAAVAIAVHHRWLPDDALDLGIPYTSRPAMPRQSSPHSWKVHYRDRANEMRAHPGEWLTIGPYQSNTGLLRAVTRITGGRIDDFRPAGAFEAVPCDDEIQWFIRARYIGTPVHQERAAS